MCWDVIGSCEVWQTLQVREICVGAVDSLADRACNKDSCALYFRSTICVVPFCHRVSPSVLGQAAVALAAKLRDSSSKVAEVAWAAIQKRLDDADPDVNRVWLEEVRCIQLNPSVRSEAGSRPNWLHTDWVQK